jgi:triacylglycerol lipase
MGPVAWLSTALACLDGVVAGGNSTAPRVTRNPVVLVHGIYSSSNDFARLAHYLRADGHEVLMLDLKPGNGQASLEVLAQQLADFTDATLPGRRFDLVGFSMGGLVSRYYMQRLGGAERVDHFVTLAAPHHGTLMAGINSRPGILQMRRGSPFIRDLEQDQDSLKRVKFTTFHTPLDLVIIPGASGEMPQAHNVKIWALMHPSLILQKGCLRAVAAALRG